MTAQDAGNGQHEHIGPHLGLARSTARTIRVGLVLIAAAALVIGGWVASATLGRGESGSGSAAAHAAVAVYGDSLVRQSTPYLKVVGAVLGLTVTVNAIDGGAPCDELPALRRDVAAEHLDLVVWAFSGNNSSACMRSYMPELAELGKYRVDTQAAIDASARAGALFVLASPPAGESADQRWRLLDSLYRGLAFANPGIQYADASQQIAPDGRFAPTQTCLPFERLIPQAQAACTNPAAVIPVRGQDGAHFCPVPFGAPCNGYASGAMRYAINLLGAARLEYDYARTTTRRSSQPSAAKSTSRSTQTS